MSTIVIIGGISMSEEQRSRLETLGVLSIAAENETASSDEGEVARRIGDAEIVLTTVFVPISGRTMRRCANLKFIQTWSNGTDHIDLEAAQSLGIRVANVTDYCTNAVAERVLGAMLLLAGRLHEAHASAKKGEWDFKAFVGTQLQGKRLLSVGSGRIASRVMELANAFGMETVGTHSRTGEREFLQQLSNAHFISVHCPLNQRTRHLIGEREFSRMRGAVLVNYARGGIVDERAMLRAIEKGNLRYAAVDVCEGEPPSKDNPLLHHPKVFVTPHCAWNTEESAWQLTEEAIHKIERFAQGTLENFVV